MFGCAKLHTVCILFTCVASAQCMVNSHPIRFAHMFSIVKCFVVRKGSEFTTQLSKQDVDLTPEMIQRYSVNGTVYLV